MSCDFGKDIALVADMLDLLETDNLSELDEQLDRRNGRGTNIPSTLRRIFRAKTLFSSPAFASFNRTSHTRAKVPDVASAMRISSSIGVVDAHPCPAS